MPARGRKLDGARVLLGVTGSIAAYKAVELASGLVRRKAKVAAVMTAAACELVGPKSFEAVTGMPAHTGMWNGGEYRIGHVNLADWADVVAVAPATANIISKAAHGICDDLLSTVLCACWEKPVLFAPAMNERMWRNPVVRDNAKILAGMGAVMVGPKTGRLACGAEGTGRMAGSDEIIEAIEKLVKCDS
jgi:phosphopantothenoylcysteine decarboxylase/phosphopantothenate--cysteine ligase